MRPGSAGSEYFGAHAESSPRRFVAVDYCKRSSGCARAIALGETTSAGIQPIGINCSRWVEAELRQVPTDRGFVGTAARDEVSDRTLAAPASGKYSGRRS